MITLGQLKEKAKDAVASFEAKSAGDHVFKEKLGHFFEHLLSIGKDETPPAPEAVDAEINGDTPQTN